MLLIVLYILMKTMIEVKFVFPNFTLIKSFVVGRKTDLLVKLFLDLTFKGYSIKLFVYLFMNISQNILKEYIKFIELVLTTEMEQKTYVINRRKGKLIFSMWDQSSFSKYWYIPYHKQLCDKGSDTST